MLQTRRESAKVTVEIAVLLRTYFDDDGEKFFKRFIDAHVEGV